MPVGPAPSSRSRVHAGAFLTHVCVGLYATSFGPALPFFARDFNISLDKAGLLLSVLFVGSISSSALLAWRLRGRDPRRVSLIGVAVSGLGVAGLGLAPTLVAGVVAAGLVGLGDGLVIAGVHQLMAETSTNVPQGINRLNVFFALGAVVGPLWAGVALKVTDERWPVFAGIAATMAVAFAVLASSDPRRLEAHEANSLPGGLSRTAVAMGSVLFLYVGAEIGLGSWVASYAKEAVGAGLLAGAALTSGYWAALGAGRLTSGWLFGQGRSGAGVLSIALLGATIASLTLAITTGSPSASVLAAVATGFCFGPIWPAAIGVAAEHGVPGGAASMVTAGNAGGVAIPFLQGTVLVASGAQAGISVTAALCAAMLVVAVAFRLRA